MFFLGFFLLMLGMFGCYEANLDGRRHFILQWAEIFQVSAVTALIGVSLMVAELLAQRMVGGPL